MATKTSVVKKNQMDWSIPFEEHRFSFPVGGTVSFHRHEGDESTFVIWSSCIVVKKAGFCGERLDKGAHELFQCFSLNHKWDPAGLYERGTDVIKFGWGRHVVELSQFCTFILKFCSLSWHLTSGTLFHQRFIGPFPLFKKVLKIWVYLQAHS